MSSGEASLQWAHDFCSQKPRGIYILLGLLSFWGWWDRNHSLGQPPMIIFKVLTCSTCLLTPEGEGAKLDWPLFCTTACWQALFCCQWPPKHLEYSGPYEWVLRGRRCANQFLRQPPKNQNFWHMIQFPSPLLRGKVRAWNFFLITWYRTKKKDMSEGYHSCSYQLQWSWCCAHIRCKTS